MSKKVNGEKFDYYLPNEVKTTQNTQLIEKLLDKDEYVLALFDYRGQGKKRLAIRWYTNLGNTKEKERLKNGEKLIGYPNVRGKPAWFILPDTLLKDIQNELLLKKE